MSFEFPCQFLRMFNIVMRIFMLQYLIQLYQGSDKENATDHPVQNVLIAADAVCYYPASKYKHTVTQQCAQANSNDISILMTVLR
jgi:hypothetical protein